MTDKLFCYHCRTYHSRDKLRQVATRSGYRWRCIASLQGARLPIRERDAFGRAQSVQNQAEARRLAVWLRTGEAGPAGEYPDARTKPPGYQIGVLWR